MVDSLSSVKMYQAEVSQNLREIVEDYLLQLIRRECKTKQNRHKMVMMMLMLNIPCCFFPISLRSSPESIDCMKYNL